MSFWTCTTASGGIIPLTVKLAELVALPIVLVTLIGPVCAHEGTVTMSWCPTFPHMLPVGRGDNRTTGVFH